MSRAALCLTAVAMFCVESVSCFPYVWRHFFHCPAQDSNLAKEAFGILAPSARRAVATRPVGSEIATLVGNHSVRKPGFERHLSQAAISGETRLRRIPSRDGGTRSQHVWRIALLSQNICKILKKLQTIPCRMRHPKR